jgi:GGDEF domain-containing protein
MNKYEEVIQSIFLSNDGQIDLLTGALAPDQFDQIAKRDLGIADRNSSQTAIISVVLDLQQYLPANYAVELDKIKSDIESELVKLHFELKNIFRQTDCICRVSKLGFWILLNGSSEVATRQLIERASKLLPEFVQINSCQRLASEALIDWYQRIDKLHFNLNK